MRRSSLAIAGLLATSFVLGACSDEAGPGVANEAVDQSATAGGSIALADLPTQRAGIWRSVTTVNGDPQEPVRECLAAAKPLFDEDAGISGCNPEVRRLASGFRLEAQCRSGDGASGRVRADVTGDFQRRLKVDMQTSQTLPGEEPVVLNFRMESVYEGPCAPGQEPGEIEE